MAAPFETASHFHGSRETQEQKRQRDSQGGIQKHYGAVALHMRHRCVFQRLRQTTATERAEGSRQRTGQRVPRKYLSASRRRNNMGKRSLFDREKRPNFIAAWTDDADGAGDDEEEQIARDMQKLNPRRP